MRIPLAKSATLFEGMVPGSGVLALAIEHTWAVELVNALYARGILTEEEFNAQKAKILGT